MMISDCSRLWLYITMGVAPIWQDFFIKSTDYSFRGLMMPIIGTISAAVAITLAKTSAKMDTQPTQNVQVVNPPSEPLPVTETKPPKAKP